MLSRFRRGSTDLFRAALILSCIVVNQIGYQSVSSDELRYA